MFTTVINKDQTTPIVSTIYIFILAAGSGGYCTILSQLLVTDRLRRALPYLAKYRDGINNWWQVVFLYNM